MQELRRRRRPAPDQREEIQRRTRGQGERAATTTRQLHALSRGALDAALATCSGASLSREPSYEGFD
eukprot:scaffold27027_cov72-Phaeocystis_antarctica.AAC.4